MTSYSNQTKGILYLIPNLLVIDASLSTLPPELIYIIKQLKYFLAENLKPARRFFKKINPDFDLSSIDIKPIRRNKAEQIDFLELLSPCLKGFDVGLLSDAGLPCVADPGHNLVLYAHQHNIVVKPLVGPSSIFLALMASGLNGQNFAFTGYLPFNEARKKRLIDLEKKIYKVGQTQIFMETPYRNVSLMKDLIRHLNPKTKLCVACNLTLPEAFIQTRTIDNWKKFDFQSIHRKPTMFLLGI